jgi:hypothetical protein
VVAGVEASISWSLESDDDDDDDSLGFLRNLNLFGSRKTSAAFISIDHKTCTLSLYASLKIHSIGR